jgi:hypothetical protein
MPKTKADLFQLAAQHRVGFNELQEKPEKPERFQLDEAGKAEVASQYKIIDRVRRSLLDGYERDADGEPLLDAAGNPVPLSPVKRVELTRDTAIRGEFASALAQGRAPRYAEAMFGSLKDNPVEFAKNVDRFFNEGFFNTDPKTWQQGREWRVSADAAVIEQQEKAQKVADRLAAQVEAKQQVAELAQQQRRNARRGGPTATSAATDDEFKPKLSPFGQKAADFASQGYGRSDTTPKDLTVDPEVLTGEGAMRLARPSSEKSYGNRADGTPKGKGWLGELTLPDGRVATEISVGVKIDGKETEIPLLVPGLTKKEIDHLLSGKDATDAIVEKAVEHAKKRIRAGKSPFK